MNITEEYFKALGWKRFINTDKKYCTAPITNPNATPKNKERRYWSRYPNITQSFPDFKKWVLEKMEGEGWRFFTIFGYANFADKSGDEIEQEIKDNEILEAAVIAATRYLNKE